MKYENFQQAKNLVEQINKHKERLENLEGYFVTVIINTNEDRGRIFTIGTDGNCEHEYAAMARKLVADIKSDLTSRIDNLKSMLSEL